MFQYISCYSLSCGKDLFKWESWEFQYISCYSLSTTEIAEMAIDLFQYISCYSLSWKLQKYIIQTYMFQYISCYSLSLWINTESALQIRFNTSHVTLYLYPAQQDRSLMIVSIHLMLLFIYEFHTEFHLPMRFNTSHVTLYHSEAYRKRTNSTFQYISCYSLSVGD